MTDNPVPVENSGSTQPPSQLPARPSFLEQLKQRARQALAKLPFFRPKNIDTATAPPTLSEVAPASDPPQTASDSVSRPPDLAALLDDTLADLETPESMEPESNDSTLPEASPLEATPTQELPPTVVLMTDKPSLKDRLLSLKARFRNLFRRKQGLDQLSAPASRPLNTKMVITAGVALLIPVAIAAGYYLSIILNTPPRETPQQLLAKKGLAFDDVTFVTYAERGNMTVVDLFLDGGIGIEAVRPFDRYTALIAAADRGQTDIVKRLLSRGANVKAKDRLAQSALIKAAKSGHVATAQALIDAGGDVNSIDKYGFTALKYAVQHDRTAMAELLRKRGATEPAATDKSPAVALNSKKSATDAHSATTPTLGAPTVSVPQEYALNLGNVGSVQIGMTADAVRSTYSSGSVLSDEIYTSGVKHQVLTIFLPGRSSPSMEVNIGNSKENVVTSIDVLDDSYRTNRGVSVGSTLGDLRRSHSIGKIDYEDGSFYATAPDVRMRFSLKMTAEVAGKDWLNGADTSSLPDSLPIQRITLY